MSAASAWRFALLLLLSFAVLVVADHGSSRPGATRATCLIPATIVGTQGDDVLTGTTDADSIVGLGGNDEIIGGGGSDKICGGPGNDKITTEAGNTDAVFVYVKGGPGDDVITMVANDWAGHSVSGGAGNDTIDCGTRNSSLSYDDATAGVVVDLQAGTARGGSGKDSLIRCGGEIWGSRFDDVLRGTRYGERFPWSRGDDRIFGRGGNDQFDAGPGNDVLNGGPGKDEVTFAHNPRQQKGVVVIDLRREHSSGLKAGIGNDRLHGIENVFGTYGPDVIIGSAGSNVLTGDDGDDRLFGGGGNDTLRGQRGRDALHGGPGRDMGDGGRAQGDSCVSVELRRRCD